MTEFDTPQGVELAAPVVRVRRREPPPLPPAWVCAICTKTVQDDVWRREPSRPPICDYCAVWWSDMARGFRTGPTRREREDMARVLAIIAALEWEAKNGRWANRYP